MDEVAEFGIEQEHFVLHEDGTPPDHMEIDGLLGRLCRRGYRARATDAAGRLLSVEQTIDGAPLYVTNDSCTHIIEVAFPPLRDLDRFRTIYCDVFGLLRSLLDECGLKVVLGSALNPPPTDFHWRPKESDPEGVRLKKNLHRPPIAHPLFYWAFPGCFAATHVSLTVPEADAYARLPAYYAFEFLVPLYFSNATMFQGVSAHCIRPLAWMANFHRPYPLLGVPDPIPTTAEVYQVCRDLSIFRDYSFVAVRSATRLEFRSACSQDDVEGIIDLIRFRSAVHKCVHSALHPPFSPSHVFTAACQKAADLPLEWAIARLRDHWIPNAASSFDFRIAEMGQALNFRAKMEPSNLIS